MLKSFGAKSFAAKFLTAIVADGGASPPSSGVARIWQKRGRIVGGKNGLPVECDHCPCGEVPPVYGDCNNCRPETAPKRIAAKLPSVTYDDGAVHSLMIAAGTYILTLHYYNHCNDTWYGVVPCDWGLWLDENLYGPYCELLHFEVTPDHIGIYFGALVTWEWWFTPAPDLLVDCDFVNRVLPTVGTDYRITLGPGDAKVTALYD